MEKQNPLKTKSFFAVIALFIISFLLYHFYPDKSNSESYINSEKLSDTLKIELKVKGMTCGGCDDYIEYLVNKIDGVIETSASNETELALVTFNRKITSEAKIRHVIDSTKYEVTSAELITE